MYGLVSTGNMNEKTARLYGDHCLLTANRTIMEDVNRVFSFLTKPKERFDVLKACKTLIACPTNLRNELTKLIDNEIKLARKKKPASILLKMNSLSDEQLIGKLIEAATEGVKITLIVRGIFCMLSENKHYKEPVTAISIVDQYLEHARVFVFGNDGKEKIFISSADWMVRNLDHRVEVTCPVFDEEIKKELKKILDIQLHDNVKARILDNRLRNEYVQNDNGTTVRSQMEIFNYLLSLKLADKKSSPDVQETLTESPINLID